MSRKAKQLKINIPSNKRFNKNNTKGGFLNVTSLQSDSDNHQKLTFDNTKPPAIDQRRLTKINSVDRDMVVMLHNYTGRDDGKDENKKKIHTDNSRSKAVAKL